MALANRQIAIREANGELIALFYFDVVNEMKQSCEETSEMMDEFGWRGGWRIEDTDEMDIFYSYGTGGDVESRFLRRFPITYIIETSTMKVVAGEKGDEYDPANEGLELDVVAEVEAIDQAS